MTLVEEELAVEAAEVDVMMAVDAALSSRMLSSHQQKTTTRAVDAVLSLNLLFKKNPLDIDEEEEEERRLLSLPSSTFSFVSSARGDDDDDEDDDFCREKKASVGGGCRKKARISKSLAQTASDKPPDFVVKLYSMFSELGPDLIKWDSGKISIPGPSNRLAAVLPKYFRHGKFTSFQRQLNNFGFHKKISESSSKLRVYSREDMIGYPAEALLDLRRTPEKGCATWRQGCVASSPEETRPANPMPGDEMPWPTDTSSSNRSLVSTLPPLEQRPEKGVVPKTVSPTATKDEDPNVPALAKPTKCEEPKLPSLVVGGSAGQGDMMIASDDDCIDSFLDFLDKQVCGNLLSSDAVDLFKSTDLGLELTSSQDVFCCGNSFDNNTTLFRSEGAATPAVM